MSNKDVIYTIKAENQTKPAFDDVKNSANSVSNNISSKFSDSFKILDSKFGNFGSKASKIFTEINKAGLSGAASSVAVAAAVVAVAAAYIFASKKLIDFANAQALVNDQIAKNAKKIQLTINDYQDLSYILQINGTTIDKITPSIARLQTAITSASQGSKEAIKQFYDLGVSIKNNDGTLKTSGALFKEIIVKISEIKDEGTKAAITNKLFGESYQHLIPLLGNSAEELKLLNEESEKYRSISEKMGKLSEKNSEAQLKLKLSIEKVKNIFAEGFIEEATRALEIITSIVQELGPAFETMGDLVRIALIPANLAINVILEQLHGIQLLTSKEYRVKIEKSQNIEKFQKQLLDAEEALKRIEKAGDSTKKQIDEAMETGDWSKIGNYKELKVKFTLLKEEALAELKKLGVLNGDENKKIITSLNINTQALNRSTISYLSNQEKSKKIWDMEIDAISMLHNISDKVSKQYIDSSFIKSMSELKVKARSTSKDLKEAQDIDPSSMLSYSHRFSEAFKKIVPSFITNMKDSMKELLVTDSKMFDELTTQLGNRLSDFSFGLSAIFNKNLKVPELFSELDRQQNVMNSAIGNILNSLEDKNKNLSELLKIEQDNIKLKANNIKLAKLIEDKDIRNKAIDSAKKEPVLSPEQLKLKDIIVSDIKELNITLSTLNKNFYDRNELFTRLKEQFNKGIITENQVKGYLRDYVDNLSTSDSLSKSIVEGTQIGQVTLNELIDELHTIVWEEQYKLQKQSTIDFVKSTNDMFKQVNNNIKESLSSFKGTDFNPYDMLKVNAWIDASYAIQDAVTTMGDNLAENAKTISTITLTIFDTINEIMDLNLQKRLSTIDKEKAALDKQYNNDKERLDNTRMSRRRHDELMSRLDKKKQEELEVLNKKAEEETKRAAKKAIGIQILQALAAGGLASMQLWADPNMNYYMKIGMQVGLVAQTAATVGLIASQLSKFATGGIVNGNNTSGDNEIVRVNSGEMILNKRQQTELFNIANGSNSHREATNIVINQTIGNNVDSYMLQEANNKQIESLRVMLETMNSHGSLAPIIRNAI